MNSDVTLDYGLSDEGPFAIETKRLLLRDVRDEDIDALVGYFGEPSAQAQILARQKNPEHRRRSLEAAADCLPLLKRGHFRLVIEVKDSGQLAGTCNLSRAEVASPSALLGWHISQAHANKGYATESGAAMLAFAFEQRKIRKIVADCFAHNATVQRVLAKLGMRKEPLFWFDQWRLRWAYGERGPIVRFGIDAWATSSHAAATR